MRYLRLNYSSLLLLNNYMVVHDVRGQYDVVVAGCDEKVMAARFVIEWLSHAPALQPEKLHLKGVARALICSAG